MFSHAPGLGHLQVAAEAKEGGSPGDGAALALYRREGFRVVPQGAPPGRQGQGGGRPAGEWLTMVKVLDREKPAAAGGAS